MATIKKHYKVYVILSILIFAAFFAGYNLGIYATTKAVYEVAQVFIKQTNNSISISTAEISAALWQYRHQIVNCINGSFKNEF